MRVRLDAVEWELEPHLLDQGKKPLLEVARKLAAEKGAVISAIEVDGVQVDEEAFLSLSGGVDIHFVTQPIRELLQESLEEGRNYFPSLLAGLEKIADLFEKGQSEEALRLFALALEGVSWILQVIDRASLLLCVHAESSLMEPFSHDFNEMCGVINQLSSVLEGGRHLEIAYRIREELLPSLRKLSVHWERMTVQAAETTQ